MIRKVLIKIKIKLKRLRSYLHKIDKKLERNQELKTKLSKTNSIKIKNFKKDKEHLATIDEFNDKYFDGYKSRDWNMLFTIYSGIKSEKYIPEDIWINHLTPRFNNLAQMPAYEDKNLYDHLFHDLNKPEIYFRNFNNQFYDSAFVPISYSESKKKLKGKNKFIVKPAWRGSGRGQGIKIFTEKEIDQLFQYLRTESDKNNSFTNFIVQEYIIQHDHLSTLYSKSLNTIKIMTARIDEIEHINSYFRVGRKNSNLDNGYVVTIKEDGRLTQPVFDWDLNNYHQHEDTGVRFSDVKIPSYNKAIHFCKKAHNRLHHFDIVSWDIAINKDGDPVFIEMNLSAQDIQFLQMTNGPLFGEYTERILGDMDINLHFNI